MDEDDSDSDDLEDSMADETMPTSLTAPTPASASNMAGEAAVAVGGVGEAQEGEGWAGVSTLKTNYHKVGPGQPVLLVEQYCQPVCCSRRVFLSILHVRTTATLSD